MNTNTTMQKLTVAAFLTALLVMALSPAALAADNSKGHGWEQTGVATGENDSNGQSVQAEGTTVQTAREVEVRGWEATGVATGESTRDIASTDSTSSTPVTTYALYALIAALAATLAAVGGMRVLRSHRPQRVA